MPITTKTGDKGKTGLNFGTRVAKDDIRVEVCGTLDELCSFLGLAKSFAAEKKVKRIVELIQKDLFVLGAETATAPRLQNRLKKKIGTSHISRLEKIIDGLETDKAFTAICFYLPGQNTLSSCLDAARTIARRAERRVVTLARKKYLSNDQCIIYLNRVSDLLYLLARAADKKSRKVRC